MTDTHLATPLLWVATALALILVVRGLRRIVARGEWGIQATLVFLLAAFSSSLVDIAVTFTDTWKEERDPFGNVVSSPPDQAYLVQLVLYVLVLVCCVGIVLVRVARPGTSLNLPAVLFLLVALVSDASAILHGDNSVRPFYLVFLAVLATAAVAPRGLGVHVGLGVFCMCAAMLAGVALLLNSHFSVVACGVGKCGLLGFNFRGWLDNENALALYLSLAMPFIYIAFGRRSGTALSAYVLLIVLLTGSRSGAVAAVITYVLLLVVRPDIRRPVFSLPRAGLLYGVLASAVVVGIVLPSVTQDPTAYTGRAYLWILARQALSDGPTLLFGSGALGWQHFRDAGLIDYSAVYSVHNQWLQVLFSAGVLGVLLMAAGLVLLVVQAGRRYSLVVGCVLAPVLCLAVTERPWPIDIVDWLVWALPGALLCCPPVGREGQPRTGAAVGSPGFRVPGPGGQTRPVADGQGSLVPAAAPGHGTAGPNASEAS